MIIVDFQKTAKFTVKKPLDNYSCNIHEQDK